MEREVRRAVRGWRCSWLCEEVQKLLDMATGEYDRGEGNEGC